MSNLKVLPAIGIALRNAQCWRDYALLALAYLLATLLSQARFMGDTVDYAADALRFNRHAWEFGHLWWVPLAWTVRSLAGVETKAGIVRILMVFNWIAGLACVMLP